MIDQHQSQHGFGDGRGAQADAGVVATVGFDLDALAVLVDGAARHADR